jgi:hypothetical protein
MISYSTAKAEAVGVPPPRGAMRRGERAVYLITAAGLTSITKVIFADTPTLSMREAPMILAIAIVAGVANVSAVQRLGAIIQLLRARQPPPPPSDSTETDGIVTKRETPIPGGG